MNKNNPSPKDFNIEEANNQTRKGLIEIVKISADLEMVKDESGIIYNPNTTYFLVCKGAKIRDAVKDALGFLKTQTDKSQAVIKYKEFEVSFTRNEKLNDILANIYAIEEFLQNQACLENPSLKPLA